MAAETGAPARGVIRDSPRATAREIRSLDRCAPAVAWSDVPHGSAREVASSYACGVACCSSCLASLSVPASAAAHLKSGTLSTDFEARVGALRPAAPGVAARVLDGDQRLELRVEPGSVVVVLGLLGEPFLRFSPSGVEANVASPTASSTRVISVQRRRFLVPGDVAPGERRTGIRLA